MSATMARQGGCVQLEQSDMRLVLNMAKMAKGEISCAMIEEKQYLVKIPYAEVWEDKKQDVKFPEHKTVKAAIERHPAMLRQNQTDVFLPCHNGTANNLPTRWRQKGTGAPPSNRRRQMTQKPTLLLSGTPAPPWMPAPPGTPPPPGKPASPRTPAPPGTPTAPPGSNAGAQCSQIFNVPAGDVHSHTSLPCAEWFTLDSYAQDSHDDTDFDPDILSDEGISTG